jgi:hypothetical protein
MCAWSQHAYPEGGGKTELRSSTGKQNMATISRLKQQPGVAGNEAGSPANEEALAAGAAPDRDALYRQVRDTLAGSGIHDEEVQYELGRWVHMLETTAEQIRAKDAKGVRERLNREAGAAIPALLSEKPELVFARTLRVQAEIEVLRHNGWLTRLLLWMTGGSPVLTVWVGAFAAAAVGVVTAAGLWHYDVAFLKALTPLNSSAALAAAFIGGLVSVLTRLQGFARLTDVDHVFQFVNAFARPFIGAAFGVFAFAALQGNLIPLDKDMLQNLHAIWAIGFLAGFSERFGPALITRGEGLFSGGKK